MGEHLAKKKAIRTPQVKLVSAAFCSLLLLALLWLSFTSTFSCQPSLPSNPPQNSEQQQPLHFMRAKKVVLVSHELTLSGGPLLLMELAILLRNAGAIVQWMTINHRENTGSEVTKALELKLQEKRILIVEARGSQAVKAALEADLIVLNTAVAGKWLDSTLKSELPRVLPKVLWWIHEMRGHYFTLDYVKHIPGVAGVMIDSHATAEYWKNRTQARLGLQMPEVYVVHLGNSREFTEAAEDDLAGRLLRQHVRESLGIPPRDIIFSAINSVSRGKGQDLFLKAFAQALPSLSSQESKPHAVIVGSDRAGQPKFEDELREVVRRNKMEHLVHFVNKTMNVVPYLAATDVLVQNSQARGECFGRISIEAMAFKLPVLGTAAGGTKEIVVQSSTGLLHPVGKEGVPELATNIIKLFRSQELRLKMGRAGYKRVREQFMEHHMSERIAAVLKRVLP